MPGRSGSSPPAARAERAPWTSVPLACPAPGMDDDARRLVDDEQVLVLVGDPRASTGSGSSSTRLRRRQRRPRPARRPRAGGSSARASPSTVHAPAASSRSAAAREPTSGSPARKRSSRSPAASSGREPVSAERRAPAAAAGCALAGEQQRDEQDRDADDDEAVGEVERRPVAEVEEVRHVPEPDAVERGSRRCRRSAGRAPPAARDAARPERAKKTSIQTTAIAGQHDHDRRRAREEAERDPGVLDVVDRERPDDVDLLVERELARDEVLRQLVGERAPPARSRPSAEPLRAAGAPASARRPRPAARPSVVDPTRTSGSSAPARSTALLQALAVDAQRRLRHRLEPLLGDRLAAA